MCYEGEQSAGLRDLRLAGAIERAAVLADMVGTGGQVYRVMRMNRGDPYHK
jgi:23S rRNA pseudoU1915 N3-methylase RlmH